MAQKTDAELIEELKVGERLTADKMKDIIDSKLNIDNVTPAQDLQSVLDTGNFSETGFEVFTTNENQNGELKVAPEAVEIHGHKLDDAGNEVQCGKLVASNGTIELDVHNCQTDQDINSLIMTEDGVQIEVAEGNLFTYDRGDDAGAQEVITTFNKEGEAQFDTGVGTDAYYQTRIDGNGVNVDHEGDEYAGQMTLYSHGVSGQWNWDGTGDPSLVTLGCEDGSQTLVLNMDLPVSDDDNEYFTMEIGDDAQYVDMSDGVKTAFRNALDISDEDTLQELFDASRNGIIWDDDGEDIDEHDRAITMSYHQESTTGLVHEYVCQTDPTGCLITRDGRDGDNSGSWGGITYNFQDGGEAILSLEMITEVDNQDPETQDWFMVNMFNESDQYADVDVQMSPRVQTSFKNALATTFTDVANNMDLTWNRVNFQKGKTLEFTATGAGDTGTSSLMVSGQNDSYTKIDSSKGEGTADFIRSSIMVDADEGIRIGTTKNESGPQYGSFFLTNSDTDSATIIVESETIYSSIDVFDNGIILRVNEAALLLNEEKLQKLIALLA